MVYAVIDTNVFVVALLTKNSDSATVRVYEAIADGKITPLYHKDILDEYTEVLCRPKFKFDKEKIDAVLELIVKYGVEVFPKPTGEILIDMDDLIFYEVAMEKRDDDSFSLLLSLQFLSALSCRRLISFGSSIIALSRDLCDTGTSFGYEDY